MRAVVQRVRKGSVLIEDKTISEIGRGLVVLLGVGRGDREDDAVYLAEKIVNLRIFEDETGKMNLSVADTGGEILAVSQFTLYGDCRQGRRPGFTGAAPPETANTLYRLFVNELEKRGVKVGTGVFQESMLVRIENDGPVTMLLDSRKLF
ncbi:MAG: D-aminoacyl-tRNA deacylase [Peptococcaceae bacterium]|jgi:D-tyrosyl-tRNA(Tyr) deacylase|nr:D-aminoacyl-tRNA deacylase [Peptococcaceae bacterium]MDH7525131.1 D-aminoacyl-tRNA deacylase [Peptococcaceae bacterium]